MPNPLSADIRARFELLFGQGLKWSQKTRQLAKVYPKPMKGYENGEAPEFYRSV